MNRISLLMRNIIERLPGQASQVLRLLVLAIRGNEMDYTSMRLGKAILLLSVPMVLEMVMESVFAIADIYFVSRLGSDAIATVGLTESMMTVVYAIAFGFSMGATALVARRTGEKNAEGASKAAAQAILTGLAVSLLIAVPGWFFPKELLRLMGASEQLISENFRYTQIMMGTNAVIMFLFIINAIFRSSGNPAISMKVLLVANFLNILLDPLLIFGYGPIPALGIEGAAIATSIGRGVAVVWQFYLLFRGNGQIQMALKDFRPDFLVLGSIIRLSIGGIGQNLIATASWIVMVRIVSEFGSSAVAGYTIAIRVIIFSLLPSWGLSNAAATLVGQNLGAGHPARADRSARITGWVNAAVMGGISVFFMSVPESFIRLFTTSPEILLNGADCLRIISYGCLFYGLGMVMVQALNGAGDTYTPVLLNFLCFWIIEIPLAWFLAMKSGLDQQGVYYAVCISESLLALVGWMVFRRGKWKLKKV
jgi:putative MATE family efflux protein